MHCTVACSHILGQLEDLLMKIKPEDFSKPVETLNGSTVGQHLRHTLEFFICLENGVKGGLINYDKRNHDRLIETDKFVALNALQAVKDFVLKLEGNAKLVLEVGYDAQSDQSFTLETNVYRELVYNIEHAVHHMALMKIGLKVVAPYISLPPGFGVAASTIRYQHSRAGVGTAAQ